MITFRATAIGLTILIFSTTCIAAFSVAQSQEATKEIASEAGPPKSAEGAPSSHTQDEFDLYNSTKEKIAEGKRSFNERMITIDGVKYSREQLIWDFLNVAFSDTLPYEKTTRCPWMRLNSPWKEGDGSWASRYQTRTNGLPRHGVVNKWDGEITVGIDWPKYKEADWHIVRQRSPKEKQEADSTERKRLELHAKKIVDAIRQRTSLPLVFVATNDEREKTERFARIRIVPEDQTYLFNDYKFLSEDFYNHVGNVTGLLGRFVGAVEFTPDARAQVDGFLVPEAGNSIGVSICRLLAGTPDAMLDSLIAECIVRSLGLPGMSKVNASALVGHWNAADDVVSKTVIFDGKDAVRYPGQFGRSKRERPITDFNKKIQSEGVTTYDVTLLSLLYCDAIKPGMDKLAAIDALSRKPECLEELKGEK